MKPYLKLIFMEMMKNKENYLTDFKNKHFIIKKIIYTDF